MKKTFILFVMLSLFGLALTIYAETVPTKGVVSPDIGLNVRSGPDEGSAKLGALTKGTAITIVSVSGSWYKISSPMSGYVHSGYVTVTDTKEVEDGQQEEQDQDQGQNNVDDSNLPQEEQEKVGCDIDRSLANVKVVTTPRK